MQSVTRTNDVRKAVAAARVTGATIGFVPTMGFFHEGHLALIETASRETDFVVVSIFVNPKQFGAGEDLEKYPRDLERDSALASEKGCALLFHPEVDEVYPPDFSTMVKVSGLSEIMCGADRPGHFEGVATVVTKLFCVVQPDSAYFGWKDAQQLIVIKRMTQDLGIPVKIRGIPIYREPDGLAMSSRNSYLHGRAREEALCLVGALKEARRLIEKEGSRSGGVVIEAMRNKIFEIAPAAGVDYIEIADAETLAPVNTLAGDLLIALAVRIDGVRLIDNIRLHVD